MKFLIYGAGALGQAIGCMLTADGHEVDLVLRERFIPVISGKGLQISGVLGDYSAEMSNLGLYGRAADIEDSYDYCLITTKNYDTFSAVQDCLSANIKADYVVSMQNGCGNMEIIADTVPNAQVLGARVITGFEIIEPGEVLISVTADAIHIGSFQTGNIAPGAQKLAECFSSAGHPAIAVENIHSSLFAKLLYNCALNPLGALLEVHYGALSESNETKEIMDNVIDETFEVITAMGGKTTWKNSNEYKEVFYSTLIPATYDHRASMLQDLENNKPTEVDGLLGYVCRQGEKVNVDTPICATLAKMVKFKEETAKKR